MKGHGEERRLLETIEATECRVRSFVKYAEKIQIDKTLQEVLDSRGNVADMERLCEEDLGRKSPSRTFSAKYYSKDGYPLFFYLGDRWKDGIPCVSKGISSDLNSTTKF